jgi:predicted RNA-binding protein Jag
MNSFERRIVHMFLENDQEVMTESTGKGEDRRVVIKPKHNK